MLIIDNGHSARSQYAFNSSKPGIKSGDGLETGWVPGCQKPTQQQRDGCVLARLCLGLYICSVSRRIHLWHSFHLWMYFCFALPTDHLSVKQSGQHEIFGVSIDKLLIFVGSAYFSIFYTHCSNPVLLFNVKCITGSVSKDLPRK